MGIVNAGEFDLSGGMEFGVNTGVMLTERTGAEDGDFDFCHARRLKFGVRGSKFKVRQDFIWPGTFTCVRTAAP
jgi:hypothetical protein